MKKIGKELQKEAMAYKKSLYAANPELDKYVKKRDAMVHVLFALRLLDFMWKLIMICQQKTYEQIFYEGCSLLVFFIYYLILLQSFKGKYLLWLMVAGNLLALPSYVEAFQNIKIYWAYSHTFVMMYVTELIYIAYLLFVTFWRTLLPKNRQYDKQTGKIEMQWSEYMKERMK